MDDLGLAAILATLDAKDDPTRDAVLAAFEDRTYRAAFASDEEDNPHADPEAAKARMSAAIRRAIAKEAKA